MDAASVSPATADAAGVASATPGEVVARVIARTLLGMLHLLDPKGAGEGVDWVGALLPFAPDKHPVTAFALGLLGLLPGRLPRTVALLAPLVSRAIRVWRGEITPKAAGPWALLLEVLWAIPTWIRLVAQGLQVLKASTANAG